MDNVRLTTKKALVGMVQYFRGVLPRRSHRLSPLTEVDSGPKGRTAICNNELEVAFKDIKHMVSTEPLLKYPHWKSPFTIDSDASDKQLGDIISQNNNPIAFLKGYE